MGPSSTKWKFAPRVSGVVTRISVEVNARLVPTPAEKPMFDPMVEIPNSTPTRDEESHRPAKCVPWHVDLQLPVAHLGGLGSSYQMSVLVADRA